MSSYNIVPLAPPFDIRSDVGSSGRLALRIVDARGIEIKERSVQAADADAAYAEFSNMRDALNAVLPALERQLSLPVDSRPAREVSWSFDGCERPSDSAESGLAGPVGSYILVVIVLFFVLPTLALVLLGIGIVVGVLVAATTTVASINNRIAARQDETLHYLRVIGMEESRKNQLKEDRGIAFIKPSSYSTSFLAKAVAYGRVDDRLVLAAVGPAPVRCAQLVAQEVLRQQRTAASLKKATDAEVLAAEMAARAIQLAEAQRRSRET